MKKSESKNRMNMAVINGLILGLIGLLVLITPLTEEIPKDKVAIDLISGGALTAGGFICMVLGLIRT